MNKICKKLIVSTTGYFYIIMAGSFFLVVIFSMLLKFMDLSINIYHYSIFLLIISLFPYIIILKLILHKMPEIVNYKDSLIFMAIYYNVMEKLTYFLLNIITFKIGGNEFSIKKYISYLFGDFYTNFEVVLNIIFISFTIYLFMLPSIVYKKRIRRKKTKNFQNMKTTRFYYKDFY